MLKKSLLVVVILGVLVAVGLALSPQIKKSEEKKGDVVVSKVLTEAEKKAVFNPPGDGATDKETMDYTNLLKELAIPTDTITLKTGCVADPFLALVNAGDTITIKNEDALSHELRFGTKKVFVKDKGDQGPGEAQLKIDFTGSSIMGYGCLDVDTGGAAAGGLYIIPQPLE